MYPVVELIKKFHAEKVTMATTLVKHYRVNIVETVKPYLHAPYFLAIPGDSLMLSRLHIGKYYFVAEQTCN
jgi:hypothetical protein